MPVTHLIAFLGLGFFWIHTLLMATHALSEGRRLARWGRTWRRARVGEVAAGLGPEGRFARHVVTQVGRSRGDGLVHFHDRAYASGVDGGLLRFEGGAELAVPADEDTPLWPDPAELRARAQRSTPEEFAALETPARTARGATRELETRLGVGDRVWVSMSEASAGGGETRLEAVAAFDPVPWLARRTRWARGSALAFLLVAAGCSVAVLWPPRWGLLAQVGAVAALVAFNLMQLVLKLLRDACRLPPESLVRGRWRRPR